MPKYDYECATCAEIVLKEVTFERRDDASYCVCGGPLERQFPVQAILGFMPFEECHDDGLGCDLTGHRQRRKVMASMGVIEAGDTQGGARKFDKHAPHHLGRTAPKGIKFEARKPAEEWDLATEKKDGSLERVQAKDL